MISTTRLEDDDDDNDGPMWWRKVAKHLNFYRVHVMYYVFTPLIFSAIFYASNGRYHIPYIDALFNCVSAMTVCGLTTVNLSMLTGWQQTILFILMCLGNPILVSWVVVLQRRHYFAIKFKHVLKANAEKHAEEVAQTNPSTSWSNRISTLLPKKRLDVADVEKKNKKKGIIQKLRPDMIRRMDDAPKRVNPSGYAVSLEKVPTLQSANPGHLSFVPSAMGHEHAHTTARGNPIDFEEEEKSAPRRRTKMTTDVTETDITEDERSGPGLEQALPDYRSIHSRRVSRQISLSTMNSRTMRVPKSYKHRGFGGFPMPWEIIGRLMARLFPKLKRRVTRTVTIPATMSLVSQHNEVPPGGKAVPYISFNAIVGRNSAFHHLTHEEMDELGGVEYRALNALLWIIGAPRWQENFVPPAEIRPQSPVWMTDWFFFMVLDIGNAATEAIPLGTRFLVGFFQGIAVRAAGFSAISVAELAAAVHVRSTNVYEEQSLGVFPDDDDTDEVDFEPTNHRVSTWGRYLALHARKQLAFGELTKLDMWWLGLALFLRHNLGDPSNAEWFNIFSVVFDIVSAYGTVGLSLGTPNNNFSFAGELKSFSKFILCLVMIRGRHRILPVAIDRAVMLPSELQRQLDQNSYSDNRSLSRSATRALQDDSFEARSHRRQSTTYSTPGDAPENTDGVDQLPH
ncbi:hypothetical protein C0995_011922 [Termitomyces sp. Mi166|nr:hypothetical protein C0995_011922 [Termitomyces sp. Mi166\